MWNASASCESGSRLTSLRWSCSSPLPLFQGGGPSWRPPIALKSTWNGIAELPPDATATARTITATTTTTPPPRYQVRRPCSQSLGRGGPPFERTGGGAVTLAARRASLLFLPLGTVEKRSGAVRWPGRGGGTGQTRPT